MKYIDTHCHISDEAFKGEEDLYVSRALDEGIGMMLLPDIDSTERDAMFAVADRFPEVTRPMIGLYPGSVDASWKEERDRMLEYFDRRCSTHPSPSGCADIVAVGEIGLDYHEGREYAAEQKAALEWQLEFAKEHDLPVNIHLRDAMGDFLEIIRKHKGLRGNMHAYSGSIESFRELRNLGDWYIGVGGVVTFRNASLADVVKEVPLERILLETDAPYLTPAPYRGKRNESSYIPYIAARIASIKEIDIEEVARATTANAAALFGL